MADIFISYSSQDQESALSLVHRLKQQGYDVWIDQAKISGALEWSGEIVEALNTCSTVIFLISANSIRSHNCAKEVYLASEKQKHILPVILEHVELPNALQYHLAGLQYVQFEDSGAIEIALEHLRERTVQSPFTVSAVPDDGTIHLAVLPFDDQSPSQDNGWFADGMTEDLIGTLGLIQTMSVSPRNDVMYYKDKRPTLNEVSADLHVHYVVSGSVQKAGEKIRIRVSLSDTHDHKQIWSEKYDGIFDDVFDLQDRTARSIAEALRLKLTAEEEQKIDKRPTDNIEAYELFLKAHEYFTRHTQADYDRALSLYEEAIHLDPNFADAYSRIANIYQEKHRYFSQNKEEYLQRTEQAVARIKEIEGESARWNLGMCQIALRRNDPVRALEYARQAVVLEPENPGVYSVLGFAHHSLGNLKETADAWEEEARLRKTSPNAHFNFLGVLILLDDKERLQSAAAEAIPVYERHLRFMPDDYSARVQYANILEWVGRRDDALKEALSLTKVDRLGGVAYYNLSCLLVHCKEFDAAIECLGRSLDKGYSSLDLLLKDPDLDPLRQTPAFKAFVKRLQQLKQTETPHAAS